MAFKKLQQKLPPRVWLLKGFSRSGKSVFSMNMRGPILPIDADNKLFGSQQYAIGEVMEFSSDHADTVNVARIESILELNMPDSGIKTIVVDSVTPILEPLILKAMESTQTNKISAFASKAAAMKKLAYATTKWGCDVLFIYHIEETTAAKADGSIGVKVGDKVEKNTITDVELARLNKHFNMSLTVVEEGKRRGIRIDYAQHGRYGMTLWDDNGYWRGMPERIEEIVYASGVLAEPERPTSFADRAHAIAWGMAQGVFKDEVHAKNSYEKLKAEKNPQGAQAMWTAWIAKVDGYVADSELEVAA
jgi:hypothetical protein